jgi:CRISP-associated protein Cas1
LHHRDFRLGVGSGCLTRPNRGVPSARFAPLAAFTFVPSELEHPKVDRSVLAFLKSEALHPADFMIRGDGVCRLNTELARRIAGLAT